MQNPLRTCTQQVLPCPAVSRVARLTGQIDVRMLMIPVLNCLDFLQIQALSESLCKLVVAMTVQLFMGVMWLLPCF